jgi:hypothetical protein
LPIESQDEEINNLRKRLLRATDSKEQAEVELKAMVTKVEEDKKKEMPPLLEWDNKAPESHRRAYTSEANNYT